MTALTPCAPVAFSPVPEIENADTVVPLLVIGVCLLLMLITTLIGLSPPLLLGILIDQVLSSETAVPSTVIPLLGQFDRPGLLKLLVLTLLLESDCGNSVLNPYITVSF